MAEKYDEYDYSYRNKKKEDLFDTSYSDSEDRAFSSMAEFNERFADLFKGRENSYNLNGDIYYKGKKVYNAAEYVPDTKKETINKKGKVKSKSKKKSGLGFVIFFFLFCSVASGILDEIDGNDIKQFAYYVRYIVNEILDAEDTQTGSDNNDVTGNEAENNNGNTSADIDNTEDYDSVKRELNFPASAPVDSQGEINVCGTTIRIGMTGNEVKNLGYEYDEYYNDETGVLERINLLFSNDEDSNYMVTCYFILKDGGDKDNLEDYILDSLYTGYWYVYEKQMHIYYNAEILYGIKTDMQYDEVIKILEDKELDDISIYDEGDYPSVLFTTDEYLYYVLTDKGRVSQLSIEARY